MFPCEKRPKEKVKKNAETYDKIRINCAVHLGYTVSVPQSYQEKEPDPIDCGNLDKVSKVFIIL